jgi:hypothetical protein
MNYYKYIKDNILKIILLLYISLIIILYIKQSTENFTEHFCLIGCSSSSSTIDNKYDTSIINKSDVETLNKSVNEYQTNTIVNQASSCSAGLSASNNLSLTGVTVGADIEIGDVDQTNSGTVSFDCVQKSAYSGQVTSGIASTYLSQLNNSYTTDVLDKIDSTTAAKASSGFLSLGSANSKTKVNTDYKFTNVTDTRKNIQNVVENAIINNLNLNDTQECIATLKANNSISIVNSETVGSIKIKRINQTNATALLSKCLQEKKNANNITNSILTDLGVKVSEEAVLRKVANISSSASSIAEVTGPLQDLGALLSGLFSGPFIIALVIGSICITAAVMYFTKTQGENGGFQALTQGAQGPQGGPPPGSPLAD